ncbi:hypothetical protein RMATCC62417_06323 [Rhizopus microsporus]|nr:hypothetical protein RMATCC62417_06323 [Rhizopus microsporus]
MQSAQPDSNLPAHPRSDEYRVRRPEPNVSTIPQLQLTTLGCQTNCTGMECQCQDRCVCRWHQQEVETVLVMEDRSQSRENRRFPANMAQEGPLHTPTLEADTAGVEENQSRSSARLCNGDSNMASPILVADGVEAQQDGTPSIQLQEEFLSNRQEIVKRWQEKAELSQSTAQYLTQSTRKSTSNNYNKNWKNWVTWHLSRTPKKDPLHYDPPLVAEYLVSLSSLSLQHLNVVRWRSPRYIESYMLKSRAWATTP